MDGRRLRHILVVAFVIGFLVAPAIGHIISSNNVAVESGVTFRADNGPAVTMGQDADVEAKDIFTDGKTVQLNTSKGNLSFSSTGHARVQVDTYTGKWINVSNLGQISSRELTIKPADQQKVVVSGDTDTLNLTSMSVDDGDVDFEYSGASGTTTLKIHGLPAGAQIAAVDTATGNTLDGNTTTSNGVLTLTMDNSKHRVKLQTNSFDAPSISDPSPTGDLTSAPNELSVQVNDSEFASGDSVTVKFTLDGSQIASKTVTSNGTVTASISSNLADGDHTWKVTAEDSFGNTVNAGPYTFTLPGDLTFRNESDGSLITQQVVVTVYTESGDVFTNSTTDGDLNMTGWPDEEVIVEASSSNYHNRTFVVNDPHTNETQFLLPTNTNSVEVRFKLDDKSGNFGSGTELYIKRSINVNGENKYRVIASDEFGVNGALFDLESDTRYRLVIKNDNGDTRVLGTYNAPQSETVTLTVESSDIALNDEGLEYAANATKVDLDPSATGYESKIVFKYSDPETDTGTMHVTIYERGNKSNTILDGNFDGPHGKLTVTKRLTATQNNTTWVVEYSAPRDGTTIDGKLQLGHRQDIPIPLDPFWLEVAAGFLVFLTPAVFPGERATLGAIAAGVVALLMWWLQFLPGEIGLPAIIGALVIAFAWRTREREGAVQ